MILRVIVSGEPATNYADDHRDTESLATLTDAEIGAWVRQVVITGLARGPKIARRAASS